MQYLFDSGQTGKIAPRDAQPLMAAQPPQRIHEDLFALDLFQFGKVL